jgi:putative ABC transport system ATP-binding protein
MNSSIMRCENISKQFHVCGSGVEILRDVSFQIEYGETVLISGKSGQGKSVLLSLLCGLEPLSGGEIFFDGIRCSPNIFASLRRTDIGIIFQNMNLIRSWTALENVAAALEGFPLTPHEQFNKSMAILELFGMQHRLHHLPSELSLGEQQRVAIARTLVREPRLILGDEPTGELDRETEESILQTLLLCTEEKQTAMVIASRGIFPVEYTDRQLVLEGGQLFDCSAHEQIHPAQSSFKESTTYHSCTHHPYIHSITPL